MFRRRNEADLAEWSVAVAGDSARDWLQSLGLDAPSADARLRAGGDAVRGLSFALARIWHDAPTVTRRPADQGGIAVSIVVQGSLRVSRDGDERTVGKGEAFVDSSDRGVTIESSGSVGTIEFRVGGGFLRRFGVPPGERLRTLTSESAFLPPIVAFANATLASAPDPASSTWSYKQAALENALAALMLEGGRPAPASLVERATSEIRRQAADPQFDVTALALSVGVTLRWLQAEFARTETTPHRALLAERTRVARHLLESHGGISVDEAARRSGFVSARALRDALRTDSASRRGKTAQR